MTATADRLYARLEPVAFADADNGLALQKLAAVLTAPREVFEFIYGTADHDPWGRLLDPDTCPPELLPWLAVFAGVELPPSALTEAEQRYRIKQAAGRYRCTPRAVVEELQLVLTGTKSVYMSFQSPDQWHYVIATVSAETPDTAGADRAVQEQKPAGMIATRILTSAWSWIVLGPDLIGQRATVDGEDSYVVGTPTYPTWADVVSHFATWTDVVNDTPH